MTDYKTPRQKALERAKNRQLEEDESENKGWWDAALAEMKRCIETEKCSTLPEMYLSQSCNHDDKTARTIDKLQMAQSKEVENAVKEGLKGNYRQIHPFYAYNEYDDNETTGVYVMQGDTARHLGWISDELREKCQVKLIEIFKKGEKMTAGEKHYLYLLMAINIFAVDKLKEANAAIKTKTKKKFINGDNIFAVDKLKEANAAIKTKTKKKIVSNHFTELVEIAKAAKTPISEELQAYYKNQLMNTDLAGIHGETGRWRSPKLADGRVSQHNATKLPLVYDETPNAKDKMAKDLESVCQQLGLYQFMVFRNPQSRMYGFGDADPIAKWKRDLTPDQMHANFLLYGFGDADPIATWKERLSPDEMHANFLFEAGRKLNPVFQREMKSLLAAFRGHGDQEDEKNEKDQSESILFAPVKTAERMLEKAMAKKAAEAQKAEKDKDKKQQPPFCQYMLDVLRCTVLLDNDKQIVQFYKVAKETLGDDLLFVSNDFAKKDRRIDFRKLMLNVRIVHPAIKNLEMISEIQV
eukprot:CAMPEP_0197074402 /NCGR_PEP_ID=MMETSP1384-20130603/211090_1 /TAXON_ID=29189 /ORGANISM="Ammonia sp." /LENGTH=524 /DNA_ID=CAMNT_0042513243 /DNA_START=24 /DNA_END=1595 /DNA_ORIENTATION=+